MVGYVSPSNGRSESSLHASVLLDPRAQPSSPFVHFGSPRENDLDVESLVAGVVQANLVSPHPRCEVVSRNHDRVRDMSQADAPIPLRGLLLLRRDQ